MYVDHHIGILQAHFRTAVGTDTVTEKVDYTVFYAVGHVSRVCELVGIGHGVDGKCLVERQDGGPVVLLDHLVKRVGVRCREFVYRFENAQCSTATHIGAVHHGKVAFKRHHSTSGFYIYRP